MNGGIFSSDLFSPHGAMYSSCQASNLLIRLSGITGEVGTAHGFT